MHAYSKSALRALALASALTLVLAACGSSASESTATQGQEALGAAESTAGEDGYPLPDCTGLDPSSCAYDGFDPDVDGFGFENWGEAGNLGATEMVALFGREKVCASGTGSKCVLFPAARQFAAQVNEAMAGGHCEGMAVMAARLFLGYESLGALDPEAMSTFELARENPAVSQAIEKWWATQMLPPVQQAYTEFQTFQPSEIAAALADGLTRGVGYTMGIYSEAGGHAITPIGVNLLEGKIAVSAYDNNFPGTVQRILIDPETETWSYAMGSTNPEAPTGGWEGGVGTIELTPMESRSLPSESPFSDGQAKGAAARKTSQLLVTSPDPTTRLGLMLTVDGKTYDLSDPTADLPDGVIARSTMGSVLSGKGLAVAVDRTKVGAFSAALSLPGAQAASVPVTMSIDDPSNPRVTLRGVIDQGAATSASLRVGKSGRVLVDPGEFGDAQVNVSNGLSSADFDLPEGVDMSVGAREGDGTTAIEYIDEDGNTIGDYELDYETENGEVVDIVADFDEESGEFDVTEDAADADDLDTALLSTWENDSANGDGGADASSGDEGSDQGSGDEANDQGPGNETDDGGSTGTADSGADESPADSGAGSSDDSSDGGAADEEPAPLPEEEPAPDPGAEEGQ
ncbi:MAG: hypothetical protein ACKOAF_01135 [Actinomycetes bacterium]